MTDFFLSFCRWLWFSRNLLSILLIAVDSPKNKKFWLSQSAEKNETRKKRKMEENTKHQFFQPSKKSDKRDDVIAPGIENWMYVYLEQKKKREKHNGTNKNVTNSKSPNQIKRKSSQLKERMKETSKEWLENKVII